jgi:hypothetical protein
MPREEPTMPHEEPVMSHEQPATHDTPPQDTVVQGQDTIAYAPVPEQEDWLEEPNESELPGRPRRRPLTPVPLALLTVLLVACGFIGGVLVEKGQTSSSGAGANGAFAARLAGLRGSASAAGVSTAGGSGAGGSSAAGSTAGGSGAGGSSAAGGGPGIAGRLGGSAAGAPRLGRSPTSKGIPSMSKTPKAPPSG